LDSVTEASPESGGGAEIASSEDCTSDGICVTVVGFGLAIRGRFNQYAKKIRFKEKIPIITLTIRVEGNASAAL
jgi:hypothetical protein